MSEQQVEKATMSYSQIKAITVDEDEAGRLVVRNVSPAQPRPGEITIRVSAISLNRGEVKRAVTTEKTGTRPGWDFAGVVENTNGVRGAPEVGTRVVGVLPTGAWAERVNAPLNLLAGIPDEVTDAQASEPRRVCRRPQLLRGRVYDEQDDEQVFA